MNNKNIEMKSCEYTNRELNDNNVDRTENLKDSSNKNFDNFNGNCGESDRVDDTDNVHNDTCTSLNKNSSALHNVNLVQSIFSPLISTNHSPLETFLKEKNISISTIDAMKMAYYMNTKECVSCKEYVCRCRAIFSSLVEMMERMSGTGEHKEQRQCETARPNLLDMIDGDNSRECSTAYEFKTPALTPIGDDFSFLTRIFAD